MTNKFIARKRFGQHFLYDKNIIDQIITAIDPKANEKIVEIGPGFGALTKELLQHAKKITAIELDRDLIPKLQQQLFHIGELKLYQADALRFDFSSLANKQKLRIVGNLPYNISTPLIFHLLENITVIQDMHFMLQKEVAERIAASPGGSEYGQLSVMVQYYCETQVLFFIPPRAFTPPPKVDSAFICLIPRKRLLATKNLAFLKEVVQCAFGQRRKMLRNSLRNLLTIEDLISLGIDPQQRPEQLSVDDFVKISNIIKKDGN